MVARGTLLCAWVRVEARIAEGAVAGTCARPESCVAKVAISMRRAASVVRRFRALSIVRCCALGAPSSSRAICAAGGILPAVCPRVAIIAALLLGVRIERAGVACQTNRGRLWSVSPGPADRAVAEMVRRSPARRALIADIRLHVKDFTVGALTCRQWGRECRRQGAGECRRQRRRQHRR